MILKNALSGDIDSCKAISEVMVELHKDRTIEESSLSKFMAAAHGCQSNINAFKTTDEALKLQYKCEEARLAVWFNMRKPKDISFDVLCDMMESDLVNKALPGFNTVALNIFM